MRLGSWRPDPDGDKGPPSLTKLKCVKGGVWMVSATECGGALCNMAPFLQHAACCNPCGYINVYCAGCCVVSATCCT